MGGFLSVVRSSRIEPHLYKPNLLSTEPFAASDVALAVVWCS